MKKMMLVVVVLFVGYMGFNNQYGTTSPETPPAGLEKNTDQSDAIIARAFANHESNIQISGQGIVEKILPDDNKGSRHQKFILKLASGHKLLVAHNIDLAPKINALREGDPIQFHGEYEWNQKGGVLHWTHHDPRGFHADGWLQYQGKKYQ